MKPALFHKMRKVFPIHEAFYIQDVVIDCIPSKIDTTSAMGNLSLAVLGLPGCGDYSYPLDRVSKTQWVYAGLIELYFSYSSVESVIITVASDSLGDVGFLQLERAELSSRLVIRILGNADGTSPAMPRVVLSFALRPFHTQREDLPLFSERSSEIAAKILDISRRLPEIERRDPRSDHTTMATLREASHTWPGYSLRQWALKFLVKRLTSRHQGAPGRSIDADIDEIIAQQELSIGLEIAHSQGNSVDIQAIAQSVYVYAKLLHIRFSFRSNEEDIDRFIPAQKLVFKLPHDPRVYSPTSAAKLLLQALHTRSSRTLRPRVADIDETVDVARDALHGGYLDSGPHLQARCLVVSTLLDRFQETAQDKDLEEAKSTLEDFVDAVSQGDALYGEMQALFARTLAFLTPSNDVVAINSAIARCHKALECLGDSVLPFKADINLALSTLLYKLQFSQTKPHASSLRDLLEVKDSIVSGLQDFRASAGAATAIPTDIAAAMDAFVAFGQTLGTQRDEDFTADQLRKNIGITSRAIEAMGAVSLEFAPPHLRVTMWRVLALQQKQLFRHSNSPEDLENSTEAFRIAEAIQLEFQDQPTDRISGILFGNELEHSVNPDHEGSMFGRVMAERYRVTRDVADLQDSISSLRASLEALPPGHPHISSLTRFLGLALIEEETPESIESGLSLLAKAASMTTARLVDRMEAARLVAMTNFIHRDPHSAVMAFDTYMELFVTISNTKKTAEGRYEFLSESSDDVSTAVVLAFQTERLDKALEWMEQGRGLVWSQLRDLRDPLADLRTSNIGLSVRLEEVSRRLEEAEGHVSRPAGRSNAGPAEKTALHDRAAQYFKLSKEREEILQTIQTTVPGFENFRRPLPSSVWMEHLPDSGPVIVIHMHPVRCDALALMAGLNEPFHIPLPSFSLKLALRLQELLRGTLTHYQLRTRGDESDRSMRPSRGVSKRNQNPLQDVLRELWLHVAKPIIDALALSRSDNPTTRVWWCPTGPLTFLPLHAAGIYSGNDLVTLSNYVVSSYIPTVAVLAERVQKPRSVPVEKSRILLVSVPEGKGARSSLIPGTTLEVNKIHDLLSTRSSISSLKLQGENATVAAGLREMKYRSCIHLACHAKQDSSQPLESGFLFYNNLLDLSSIIKCDLKHAELAFLSACQTSTGHEKLSEEAVHLAAGMLAAGYRGVVATMWSIPDRYAPMIAENFYSDLLSRGSTTPNKDKTINPSNAAYSIHHAVRKLRAEIGNSEPAMLAWVPYVHFGL